jgi:hypothetical protein
MVHAAAPQKPKIRTTRTVMAILRSIGLTSSGEEAADLVQEPQGVRCRHRRCAVPKHGQETDDNTSARQPANEVRKGARSIATECGLYENVSGRGAQPDLERWDETVTNLLRSFLDWFSNGSKVMWRE